MITITSSSLTGYWHALVDGIRWRRAFLRALAPLVVLMVLLGGWQFYTVAGDVNPLILPAPLHVAQITITDWPDLASALNVTLFETAIGFICSLIFGIGAATLLDLLSVARRGIYPLLVASQSVPIVALAPLLQLWFGIGLMPKVVVIVLSCFFPITVASLDGLRASDPELLRLYRSFGASPWQIFWSVRFPNALPAFFSGVRIAISYSIIGAIFSEYIGADEGLGVYMRNSQHAFRIDRVIGAIGVTALASIALFLLVMLVERLAIPWFYAERRSKGTEA
jgi:ABC-type nitrate/sulfonate/bicarbonate transport system permease component